MNEINQNPMMKTSMTSKEGAFLSWNKVWAMKSGGETMNFENEIIVNIETIKTRD